jgi:hypothetical protein
MLHESRMWAASLCDPYPQAAALMDVALHAAASLCRDVAEKRNVRHGKFKATISTGDLEIGLSC